MESMQTASTCFCVMAVWLLTVVDLELLQNSQKASGSITAASSHWLWFKRKPDNPYKVTEHAHRWLHRQASPETIHAIHIYLYIYAYNTRMNSIHPYIHTISVFGCTLKYATRL